MDAVEFIKERQRMCKSYGEGCLDCPMDGRPCGGYRDVDAERLVRAVEAWSATHPRKTRQSEFLKMFPNPALDSDGVIAIQPCEVIVDACKDSNGNKRTNCWTCRREFWMQEIE